MCEITKNDISMLACLVCIYIPQMIKKINQFVFSASGKKLTVAAKRPANATLSKSQTLPRSMGSRSTPVQPVRPFNKLSSTPPAMKKQLSVPGSNSPARKAAASGKAFV